MILGGDFFFVFFCFSSFGGFFGLVWFLVWFGLILLFMEGWGV